MHKYSKVTDLIYPVQLLSKYKDLPDDLVDITSKEAHEHMGNITYEGKRRIHHTYPFEWEDIPEPSTEELQSIERNWRDSEMSTYVDYFQSKPLLWSELSEEEKTAVSDYRILLKDYPSVDGFGDESLRPVRPESPTL